MPITCSFGTVSNLPSVSGYTLWHNTGKSLPSFDQLSASWPFDYFDEHLASGFRFIPGDTFEDATESSNSVL